MQSQNQRFYNNVRLFPIFEMNLPEGYMSLMVHMYRAITEQAIADLKDCHSNVRMLEY